MPLDIGKSINQFILFMAKMHQVFVPIYEPFY